MEFITEFSEQIRWFSAILIYPIVLFLAPRKEENGYIIRRALFFIALPLFCISYGLGSDVINSYLGTYQPAINIFKVAISIVRAIVITELIRSMVKNGILWSTQKHFLILTALTILFATINMSAK